MKERREIRVEWSKEEKELTLEGEPVLRYVLAWPRVEGGGLGGWWICRYYAALADSWRRRWQREVYCRACLDLAACRERSRPFRPWRGELTGQVALLEDGLLSLRFLGREMGRDGRWIQVRWGEMWQVRWGQPVYLRQLMKGERGWKERLWRELVDRGEEGRRSGERFLDPDWAEKAKRARPFDGCCITPEGVEVALPQCVAAPAAEGCPVFTLSRKKEGAGC